MSEQAASGVDEEDLLEARGIFAGIMMSLAIWGIIIAAVWAW
jgi:hypothetical protein